MGNSEVTGRGLLISGTSHCGKSSFAAQLAEITGSKVLSTDAMARHPGRPWPTPRSHVLDYYQNLSDETRLTLLMHHYETMRSVISLKIAGTVTQGHFIIEGSAIRASDIAHYGDMGFQMICLYTPPDVLRQRIKHSSGQLDAELSSCVDAFIRRSIADQEVHLAQAQQAGIDCVDTTDRVALRQILDRSEAYLNAN